MDDTWFVVSYVALWIVIGLSMILWLSVIRQIGILHARLGPRGAVSSEEGLPLGAELATVSVATVAGTQSTLPPEGRVLLMVNDPGCGLCEDLAPSVATLMQDPPDGIEVYVVMTTDDHGYGERFATRHRLAPERVLLAPDAAAQLQLTAAPMAMVVDPGGRLTAAGVVNSLEQLEGLVEEGRALEWAMDEEDKSEAAVQVMQTTTNQGSA
ncbi:MAG: hypothetical protein Q8K79_04430 [Solirubrobacteraceae bacterium]|jgi:methylamine dehydrogenase accessory protein MauD|nr:hypothetical protein [Solirubrobacteraceae bacterium]